MKKRWSAQWRDKTVSQGPWQRKIEAVIEGTATRAGKRFDLVLLMVILLSIIVVMLESVRSLKEAYGPTFFTIEWVITGLFSLEYLLRILSARQPLRYIFSFLGLIDLLSLLPSYLGLLVEGTEALMVIRSVRFLRIFRVLKLSRYMLGADILGEALRNSRPKITVFLTSILTIVIIMGGLMYVIEPDDAGFNSIPRSIYWAIITITTVGYGDIAPVTPLGQGLAALIMLFGYAIIAVPTGIVSSEITALKKDHQKPQACPQCGETGHPKEARYCWQCGEELP